MTDEGFQANTYLLQVKQLRLNYTIFDVNTDSPEMQQQVEDAVKKYASVYKGYETIETYEWAAHECKDMKDSNNDT